jgi:hypothetical protein
MLIWLVMNVDFSTSGRRSPRLVMHEAMLVLIRPRENDSFIHVALLVVNDTCMLMFSRFGHTFFLD